MAKLVKRADLSKKDYKVEAGVLLVKDSSYNITSNIGDGSMAGFNELDPLLYWGKPTNPKVNAIAHVLFNDGLGYYTFNGTLWVLNFFYPSSEYIPAGPRVYKSFLTQVGTSAPTENIITNNTGLNITFQYTTNGEYLVNITNGTLNPAKTDISLGKPQSNDLGNSFYITDLYFNNNQIKIYTGLLETDGLTVNPVLYDELLNKNLFKIEIYP